MANLLIDTAGGGRHRDRGEVEGADAEEPVNHGNLAKLMYYFEFDYIDGRDPESYIDATCAAVDRWKPFVVTGLNHPLRTGRDHEQSIA